MDFFQIIYLFIILDSVLTKLFKRGAKKLAKQNGVFEKILHLRMFQSFSIIKGARL